MSKENKKDKNQNKNKKKESEVGPSSSRGESNLQIKGKEKRNLRFQLPEPIHSDDSFSSALSFKMEEDDQQYPIPEYSEISVLKKFILAPLKHSLPRSAIPKQCFSTDSSLVYLEREIQSKICLSAASSSKQLFEVLRNSPTPSDADINLIKATYMRKLESMKEAIKNGANVNTFKDRQTPLMIATEIGDEKLIKYLLTIPEININFQNIFGETPLVVAIKNSSDKIMKMLLSHKASVNIPDNMGKTPLHHALFQQRPRIVKILLACGAKCEKKDCFGERPMYTSVVKKPNLECLKLLIKFGATPEYRHGSGTTLLSRAIINWTDFEIIQTLVTNGANVNTKDTNTAKTPLHYAAITNDLTIVKFLIKEGADANLQTVYNFTPFDMAVFYKSIEVADYLSNFTKNPNIKSLYALKNQHREKSTVFSRSNVNLKSKKSSASLYKRKSSKSSVHRSIRK